VIDHLANRIRARIEAGAAARQRGFITMQVLALTVLLLVAAGGLVGVAQATINTSREARDFTDARRSADTVENDILRQFAAGTAVPFGFDGTYDWQRGANGTTGRLAWKWLSNPSGKTITITSTLKGVGSSATSTTQTSTLPVRGYLTASRGTVSATNSAVSYGIPAGPRAPWAAVNPSTFAMGLWGNAVSTSAGASTILGNVQYKWTANQGTWAAFGGSITNAGRANVVAFADGITAPTNTTGFSRSRFNAFMDTRISDQIMSNARTDTCQQYEYRGISFWTNTHQSLFSYMCHKGDFTYAPVTATPSGVSTHVIKGDATLSGDIRTGSNGEMHLYVDGDVTFGSASTPGTRHYDSLYIYAPNGTCRAAAGTIINFTGSLACKTVVLDQGSNYVGWERPAEQPNDAPYTLSATHAGDGHRAVDTPKVIHYFERPGFKDQWSS
jgi:hypothetical protein